MPEFDLLCSLQMGAEIVNTVIIRNLEELLILAIVIALRAILALLIHWEIKNEERLENISAHTPTTDELRQTAVRAMTDMLSVQWSSDVEINYNKTGAVSHKDYHYDPNTLYCGLPYADGQTNLFVWLEHYDQQTGKLILEGDGQWLNSNLGNTCAGSLMWAWSTVCHSLTGNYVNYNMVPMYGCIPVGDYKCSMMNAIKSWEDYPTEKVCQENGRPAVFLIKE